MATLQPTLQATTALRPAKTGLLKRFFAWTDHQEKNRLAWTAVILTAHGCLITPLTLLFVMLAGNNFVFWPLTIASMGISLITNLSAMPTRITLPLFFLGLLVNLSIIAYCIGGLMTAW